MTYQVNPDGTISVVAYDEEPNSLESDNEYLNTWNADAYAGSTDSNILYFGEVVA